MNKMGSGDDYGKSKDVHNIKSTELTELIWLGDILEWRRGDDYGNRMFIISNTPYKMARTSQRNCLF